MFFLVAWAFGIDHALNNLRTVAFGVEKNEKLERASGEVSCLQDRICFFFLFEKSKLEPELP